MILIVSEPKDITVQVVFEKLVSRGAEVLWFDNEQFPEKAQLSWAASSNDSISDGIKLRVGGKTYNLNQITSAWNRCPCPARASSEIKDEITQKYIEQQSREFINTVWSNLDCFWIQGPHWNVRRAEQKTCNSNLLRE